MELLVIVTPQDENLLVHLTVRQRDILSHHMELLVILTPQEENLLVYLTVRQRDNFSHQVVLLVKKASTGTTCRQTNQPTDAR